MTTSKRASDEANRQMLAYPKASACWLAFGIGLIFSAIAYSVLKADTVTLKTPAFELHTEVMPK